LICIAGAEDFMKSRGLSGRAEAVGGSLFNAKDIPTGTHLYKLAFVLHDWGGEDCRRVLRAVAARMDENSTLMLVEFVPLPLASHSSKAFCS
jgi:hypothetical protein